MSYKQETSQDTKFKGNIMSSEFKKLASEAKKMSGQSFAFMLNFANELQMDPREYRDFFRILAAEHLGASIDMYLDLEGLDAVQTLQRLVELRVTAKRQRDCQNSTHNLH